MMDDNYGGGEEMSPEEMGEDLEFLQYLEEEEGRQALALLQKAYKKAKATSVSNKRFREWFIAEMEKER